MQITPGIGLREAIEAAREEDAEETAKEQTAEMFAGSLSPVAASLKPTETVMSDVGVVMQGLAAMPMSGVLHKLDSKPEPNKLFSKITNYQDSQQAQVYAEAYEHKRREEESELSTYEADVEAKDKQTSAMEEAEQEDASGQSGILGEFFDAVSQKLNQIGTVRLNDGDGSSVLWKTRQDEGGESVLQQALTTYKGIF